MKKRMQLNFMAIAMISMIAVLLLTTVVFYNLFQNEVIENLHTCADMLGAVSYTHLTLPTILRV